MPLWPRCPPTPLAVLLERGSGPAAGWSRTALPCRLLLRLSCMLEPALGAAGGAGIGALRPPPAPPLPLPLGYRCPSRSGCLNPASSQAERDEPGRAIGSGLARPAKRQGAAG